MSVSSIKQATPDESNVLKLSFKGPGRVVSNTSHTQSTYIGKWVKCQFQKLAQFFGYVSPAQKLESTRVKALTNGCSLIRDALYSVEHCSGFNEPGFPMACVLKVGKQENVFLGKTETKEPSKPATFMEAMLCGTLRDCLKKETSEEIALKVSFLVVGKTAEYPDGGFYTGHCASYVSSKPWSFSSSSSAMSGELTQETLTRMIKYRTSDQETQKKMTAYFASVLLAESKN